jgi:beta-glucosidase
MAPPQSYLDALDGGTGRFSRLVNLTDSSRTWHSEFSYFGANVYAYLLHRAGDWIDLVFLQFYESYSRAHMTILSEGITPASYLERFVEGSLDGRDLVAVVDFSDDPSVKTPARTLRIPLSKLVIGLANGWADNGDDKTLFVSTQEFDSAWTALRAKGIEPRGAGFWTIDEEGTRGAYFARELSRTIVGYSNEIS